MASPTNTPHAHHACSGHVPVDAWDECECSTRVGVSRLSYTVPSRSRCTEIPLSVLMASRGTTVEHTRGAGALGTHDTQCVLSVPLPLALLVSAGGGLGCCCRCRDAAVLAGCRPPRARALAGEPALAAPALCAGSSSKMIVVPILKRDRRVNVGYLFSCDNEVSALRTL